VHLTGGLNTGLFIDMRDHRRGLSRFVKGRRVLNTFSYTGSLSVAAARGGASHVTSVDLAAGVLAWSKENVRLAGLDPEDATRFRFEASDVFRFLEAEAAAKRAYDVVILDPPTVSGARASSWSQKNDYPSLIAKACALLPDEGGHLWVSSNTIVGPSVLKHIGLGLAEAGRRGAILELGGQPPDFPTLVSWPLGRYLEVAQVRVGPQ
jgi:23S rRNA (cytosine1962-C5)-methyltransferase